MIVELQIDTTHSLRGSDSCANCSLRGGKAPGCCITIRLTTPISPVSASAHLLREMKTGVESARAARVARVAALEPTFVYRCGGAMTRCPPRAAR